ncbi:hypothetical protein FA95DRAFT_1563670 [Auriscalpium vulgare]|uniref:Uncharacterized protein n=1 Tax=Auriscalpium vulgare TaxID=40419 RepID=A0ACB8RGN0_9AGAM|nr:hypothetical protein FA95DRAFT_1563670 [Auriscalpium vulgare]
MATLADHALPLSLPLGRDSWLYPESGAFVVFRIDPVATLEALQDPIAIEHAQSLSLSCKSYIGFIYLVLDLLMETRRYHRSDCLVLSQGVATLISMFCTDENMCIPVAPATHPQGRPAVTAVPLYHGTISTSITLRSSPFVSKPILAT